jgi:hypothetical protein
MQEALELSHNSSCSQCSQAGPTTDSDAKEGIMPDEKKPDNVIDFLERNKRKEAKESKDDNVGKGYSLERCLDIAEKFIEYMELSGAKGLIIIGYGDTDHVFDKGISGRTAINTILAMWDRYPEFFDEAIDTIKQFQDKGGDNTTN